jgi:hypothetical protein
MTVQRDRRPPEGGHALSEGRRLLFLLLIGIAIFVVAVVFVAFRRRDNDDSPVADFKLS